MKGTYSSCAAAIATVVLFSSLAVPARAQYENASEALWPIWYANAYPDLKAAWQGKSEWDTRYEAIVHWKRHGIHEGRSPNPFFNPKYYAAHNGDLVAAYGQRNAAGAMEIKDYVKVVLHWHLYGVAEGRQGSPIFEPKYYLQSNPDVRRSVGEQNYRGGLNHYLTSGAKEGRQPASIEIVWDWPEMDCIKAGATAVGAAWTAEAAPSRATFMAAVAAAVGVIDKCPIFVPLPKDGKNHDPKDSIGIQQKDGPKGQNGGEPGILFIAEHGRTVESIDLETGERHVFDGDHPIPLGPPR